MVCLTINWEDVSPRSQRRPHYGVSTLTRISGSLFLGIFCLLAASCRESAAVFLSEYPAIDLLITNGEVLDGLGGDAYTADLVIVDDEIVFVGKTAFSPTELDERVKVTIDAEQRVVAPGFIDPHSHGDPLKTPDFESFLAMGVTTISLGQDGTSPPVMNLGDWLTEVENNGIAVNLAMFVGHGTLRDLNGIGRTADPEPADLARMLELLDETLAYTFGLSTGLEYNPGLYAQEAELEALAKVVGKNDRLIMSHLRSEDDDQLEASIEELLKQGRFARIHVAHLKSVYGHGAESAERILQLLSDARDAGIRVTADSYPYNASYTGISIVFPVWAKTTDQFEVAKLTRRAELEAFLREKIARRNGAEATLLASPPYTGKTLGELARELEMPFEQVLIEEIGPQGSYGAYFVMDDEFQTRLLIDPEISISSDGSPEGFHPRGHGAFAKIIDEYVNGRQVLSLKEAVRKMTSHSASVLGITDRGILQAGKKADIVIFDPERVKATATYPEPHQLAEGFDVVIVNGRVARQDSKLSDTYSGRVLSPR